MKRTVPLFGTGLFYFVILFVLLSGKVGFSGDGVELLPTRWQASWTNPPRKDRPLQILHGWLKGWSTCHETRTWDFSTFTHPGEDNVPVRTPEEIARIFDQLGLGGVVCNVGGEKYFRDEQQWQLFLDSFRAFDRAGLRIWIYDEQGYPSLGAGGLVLEKNPKLESLSLCYDAELDKSGKDPFIIRPAFEFTHCANNVRVCRRYPNPLDPESTRLFIELTHEQYRQRLGEDLFRKIEAFFFDEPSIIAFNMTRNPGRVLPSMQGKVDPTLKELPMLPWITGLEKIYQKRYNEDLLPVRRSLFKGNSTEDRRIRRQFWTLVGELNRTAFYEQIQNYLRSNGSSVPTMEHLNAPVRLASSGHLLGEESLFGHVPQDGNKLANMQQMDLPGLDLLSSNPQARNWMTCAMPTSAAFVKGHRLVMSEISDMADYRFRKPFRIASLEWMTAMAAWQAAWGVTEFTSYYRFENQGKEAFKQYTDFVGRINSVLRNARPIRPVILFYPIEELQESYLPGFPVKSRFKDTDFLLSTFYGLGRRLVTNQIPFTIADRKTIKSAVPDEAKTLNLGGLKYGTVFVPTNLDFQSEHIKVVKTTDKDYWTQIETVKRGLPTLDPPDEDISAGLYEKSGRKILILVNMSEQHEYRGGIIRSAAETVLVLDPLDGTVQKGTVQKGSLGIKLKPLETKMYVF